METLLNFVWVLIAFAALAAWRACWMHQYRARRRDPVREWTAVVCALVLLFFAVSLSDDLHASVVLDESSGVRRHTELTDGYHANPDLSKTVSAHLVALVPSLPIFPPFADSALLSAHTGSRLVFIENERACGRAPPPYLFP